MKRTLLFVLALVAAGCADAGQSASCADLSEESPLEDVRTCAEQGYAEAQVQLGYVYARGDGVPEDDAEALRWYRIAAEQGNRLAQVRLGWLYTTGEAGDGGPEDDVLAYMWANLAAAQGSSAAQGVKSIIERRMTRAQIAEAQRLSTEWLEAHPPGN